MREENGRSWTNSPGREGACEITQLKSSITIGIVQVETMIQSTRRRRSCQSLAGGPRNKSGGARAKGMRSDCTLTIQCLCSFQAC